MRLCSWRSHTHYYTKHRLQEKSSQTQDRSLFIDERGQHRAAQKCESNRRDRIPCRRRTPPQVPQPWRGQRRQLGQQQRQERRPVG